MNISEISKPVTAASLNESLAKRFGQRLNLESYTLEKLEDVRNKMRTKIFSVETNESFDSVQNEAYQKSKLFLDVLNAEIAEREERNVTEAKAGYCSDKCCGADVKAEDCTCPASCKECNCNSVKEAKPDFLDMDKDGDKKEPMKKAIKDKDAKKESIEEGEGKKVQLPSGKEMKKCKDKGMSKADIMKKYTEMGCEAKQLEKLYASSCM